MPSEFLSLPKEEQAFIMASIQIRIQAEKEASKK
nr:MAG TPA: Protein of unknown function (DUF3113) [Caudoviricetes sp.]DAW58425.1 MAG TPA: Protein of unknown function (DUF3113) [Caudoviricetes sp.]DAX54821.1 MAG TPA: Protein of unknown function (DUF3113) [Caudoviricetes sp.]